MVRIKTMRLSGLLYPLIIIILMMTILFLSFRLIIKEPVSINALLRTSQSNYEQDATIKSIHKIMLAGGMPAVKAGQRVGRNGLLSGFWRIVSLRDIRDPRAIVHYHMPYLNGTDLVYQPPDAIEVGGRVPVPDRGNVDRSTEDPIKVIVDGSPGDFDMPDDIKIIIDNIKDDQEKIELSGEGPQILIYHSHSREAYRQDPNDPYKVAEAFRSNDLDYTVVKVGQILANNLFAKGIPVLHDGTEHEQGNYSQSYARSLETIKRRIKQHDSLKIFLDIHRNAYKEGVNKNPDDEVVIINGERVAKVFVNIGTGEGVMGGFTEKPQWEENYKFALKLTNKINELYPGLAKDVYVQSGRYNQHVSTKAILIEVGSSFTTLEEAKRSAKYLAEALSQIVE